MTKISESVAKIGTVDNIIPLQERKGINLSPSSQISKSLKNDIIDSEKPKEKLIMSQETYTKSEIDLKLANLTTKIDAQFDQLNTKLDYSVQHILSETKNLMLEQQIKEKDEREKERRVTNRWLIGLTVSIGLALIKYFLG